MTHTLHNDRLEEDLRLARYARWSRPLSLTRYASCVAVLEVSAMPISNEKIKNYDLLAGMYRDGYFPNFLVDKVKAILVDLCEQIEREQPADEQSLLKLTHAATERINELAEEFEENDSELETEAREIMGENFAFIVRAYGFEDVDIEDVIAPRDW